MEKCEKKREKKGKKVFVVWWEWGWKRDCVINFMSEMAWLFHGKEFEWMTDMDIGDCVCVCFHYFTQ